MHTNMMRRLGMALLLLGTFGLTGCAEQPKVDETRFRIEVVTRTADLMYGYGLSYAWADGGSERTLGGMSVQHADGSAITPGETLYFDFTTDDFPKDVSLREMTVYLTVYRPDGSMRSAAAPLKLTPQYGRIYKAEVSGSAAHGYTVRRTALPQT